MCTGKIIFLTILISMIWNINVYAQNICGDFDRSMNIDLTKDLQYDRHTLQDTYPYKDTERRFQWDKISDTLRMMTYAYDTNVRWGTLQNYKNLKGIAPLVEDPKKDNYNTITDAFGVSRYQSIPLYDYDDLKTPVRYARDGALVRILRDSLDFFKICSIIYDGAWFVPKSYLRPITIKEFDKFIFVDRTNQNIAAIERVGGSWYIRSMNPATTGLHHPPYQQETPLGIYVIQEKKPRMYYLVDGTSQIAGYAPYASRFTRGGYIHGVPLNDPNATEADYIEFSPTLGTTPRSHMCVRNATSHAKFIYNWAVPFEALVVVFD